MQEQDGLNSEELELERALRSLSPASAQLDPIAAALEAGRKIRQRQVRAWSSAFVVLFLAASSSLIWMRRTVVVEPREIGGSDSSATVQTPHPVPQNSPHIATVTYVSGERPVGPASRSAVSRSAVTHMPIQVRTMTLPPQPPPSLLMLQRAVEKDGFDAMPRTYLPDTGQMNWTNQL